VTHHREERCNNWEIISFKVYSVPARNVWATSNSQQCSVFP